jgi:hypothetical protein
MTQLSRKDFIKFAENISRVDDDSVRKEMIHSNINFLLQTNPRFDAGRFQDYVESLVRKRRLKI